MLALIGLSTLLESPPAPRTAIVGETGSGKPRYAAAPMAGADADQGRPARGRRGRPGGDGSPPRGRGRPRRSKSGSDADADAGAGAGGSGPAKRPASDGPVPPGADTVCFPCRGTGRVISALGGESHDETCPWCEGTGRPIADHDAQAARREQASAPGGEVSGSAGVTEPA